MAAKPCDMIKDMQTSVVVENNLHRRITRKQHLLQILSEKLRTGNSHRLMFLTRANINQTAVVQDFLRLHRFDEHRKVMLVAGQKVTEYLLCVQI